MNVTDSSSASHEALQTYFIYGSILVLLALGGFIFWSNYRYTQQRKKKHKLNLERANPPVKPNGHRAHKKHKNGLPPLR